jgi:hypothetical protein
MQWGFFIADNKITRAGIFYLIAMTQSCSFCNTPVTPVKLGGTEIRICEKCHATFLAANSFGAIRRDVNNEARRTWMNILLEDAKSFASPESPCCIEHGQALTQGTLPNVAVPGLVPSCCTTLHLPPAMLAQLLQRSLASPRVTAKDLKAKQPGFRARLIEGVLKLFHAEEKEIDDGLDNVIWETRLRPLLERK